MKYLFLSLFTLLGNTIFSQCSGGSNGGSISPTTSWQTVSVNAGNYYTFIVAAGTCDTYDFSFCQGGGSAGFDTQISIRTNADVYAGGYNDDACSLQSELMGFSPSGAGTYRVLISSYPCGASGASATLAFKKNSPGSNANYIYLNNAAASGNCITLTPASNDQKGCAWDVNSTLNFASSFSFDFTVNLGASDAGADGMAFVMHNDPDGLCVCGTSGGSLGAGGITNSLTVEIDTYLNTEDRDDGMPGVLCSGGTEPDHLDIWLNGNINPYADCSFQGPGARIVPNAVRLMSGNSLYNIENGADHILRISWNAGTSTLTATILNTTLSTTYGTISYSFNPITVFGTNSPYFGFTASTGGLSNEQSYCLPNVLLPVEITSYTASCQDEDVVLNWESSSENNNAFYFIERSNDSENYQTIFVIPGEESSNQIRSYQFVDIDPLPGENYYRLSQTNFNGVTKIIGEPLVIKCHNSPEISIYPNPAGENLTINFGNDDALIATIRIFDLAGKLILSEKKMNDSRIMGLDLSMLSSGSYFCTIESKGDILFQQKLMVTR